jgi:hypothetical protein
MGENSPNLVTLLTAESAGKKGSEILAGNWRKGGKPMMAKKAPIDPGHFILCLPR